MRWYQGCNAHPQGCVVPDASPVARIVLLGTACVTSMGMATPAATRAKNAAFCTIALMVNAVPVPPSGAFCCRDTFFCLGQSVPSISASYCHKATDDLSPLFEALDTSFSSSRKADGSPARHLDSHEWEAA